MSFFHDCQNLMEVLSNTYLLAPLESRDLSEEKEIQKKRQFVFDLVSATDIFDVKDVLNRWGMQDYITFDFDNKAECFVIKDCVYLPTEETFRFKIIIPVIREYVCWDQLECVKGW